MLFINILAKGVVPVKVTLSWETKSKSGINLASLILSGFSSTRQWYLYFLSDSTGWVQLAFISFNNLLIFLL